MNKTIEAILKRVAAGMSTKKGAEKLRQLLLKSKLA